MSVGILFVIRIMACYLEKVSFFKAVTFKKTANFCTIWTSGMPSVFTDTLICKDIKHLSGATFYWCIGLRLTLQMQSNS